MDDTKFARRQLEFKMTSPHQQEILATYFKSPVPPLKTAFTFRTTRPQDSSPARKSFGNHAWIEIAPTFASIHRVLDATHALAGPTPIPESGARTRVDYLNMAWTTADPAVTRKTLELEVPVTAVSFAVSTFSTDC